VLENYVCLTVERSLAIFTVTTLEDSIAAVQNK